MRRVRVRLDRPNPLFERWLAEWTEEAATRNSELRRHFSKALGSLRKYPLPLKSGKDCIILQHFGVKLCSMLDKRLEKHRLSGKSGANGEYVCESCALDKRNDFSVQRCNERHTAVDTVRNEGQAGLLLFDGVDIPSWNLDKYLGKSGDLSNRDARPLTIAQSSVSSNRVLQNSQDELEVNLEKSRKQVTERKARNAKNNATSKKGSGKRDVVESVQKDIYIESNNFDIILLVDTQETCGGKTKPQHDATIVQLSELGVLFEVRHLKVGDFAWIARCKVTNNELILPYVVERKRIDDLSASITDGRFHEQKFRLKQSGIENLMYIVENHDKSYRLAIPHLSLMQASVNSLVQDGFTLKYTRNHKDSMFYLSTLTRVFNQIYKEKNLIGCKKEHLDRADILSGSISLMEFSEFNKAASKQKVFKVNQMFVRQLLQLKGMSVDKALAIVESYPTPRILFDAFYKSSSGGETLLSGIQSGPKKRLLGSAISNTVYQLYTRKDFG